MRDGEPMEARTPERPQQRPEGMETHIHTHKMAQMVKVSQARTKVISGREEGRTLHWDAEK